MLAHEIRTDVDRAWDSVWSSGVTNPIVVSDLLGTLLMAAASEHEWARLRTVAREGSAGHIADAFAKVRRDYGIDPGSEIEASVFWEADHALPRAMDQLEPVIAAHGDVLGDIYEHILSKLSLAGHFGQFRTPRHIVEFMVEAMSPQQGELVADPACGSGGFLVAASDFRKANGIGGSEVGIEIDRTISRIALANTVFHGMSNGAIVQGDGLTKKFPEAPDVILANPPFAGAVSPEVSAKYGSGSNRTELLFVEAIADSLAPGGRAAVVVPSGVVAGGNGAAKYVRRRLLEQFTLDAVIELPSGVFRPYTDVKTAILMWRNARPQNGSKVKMIRVESDGFSMDSRRIPVNNNDLPEVLRALAGESADLKAAEVDPSDIVDTGYSLNPSRYIRVADGLETDASPTMQEALDDLNISMTAISSKLSRIEELIAR